MTIVNAIIIGIVYGLSEFLAVSGSGHISIMSWLFNLEVPTGEHLLFSAFLALGACISLCMAFWDDIMAGFYDLLSVFNPPPDEKYRKTRFPDARLTLLVVTAFIPFLLVLPVNKYYYVLLDNSVFVGLTLFLNGVLIIVSGKAERGSKIRTNMNFLDAIILGMCSAVAFLPGLSPIGVIIAAGIVMGLDVDFAVTFSGLLYIPVSLTVLILRLTKSSGAVWSNVPAYLVGMAVEIVAGFFALKLLRYIFKTGGEKKLSYYCLVIGFLSVILSFIF